MASDSEVVLRRSKTLFVSSSHLGAVAGALHNPRDKHSSFVCRSTHHITMSEALSEAEISGMSVASGASLLPNYYLLLRIVETLNVVFYRLNENGLLSQLLLWKVVIIFLHDECSSSL